MVMSGVVVRTITPARNPIVPRGALFATGARHARGPTAAMIAEAFYLIA
jgi:hypothetical protein